MDYSVPRNGLIWALYPISTVMRFIGIELDCSLVRSRRKRLAVMFFGVVLLVFNSIVNGTIISFTFHQAFVEQNGPTSGFVRSIVFFLGNINQVIFSVGPHFTFTITVYISWKNLFNTMKRIENDFQSDELFRKCRKMTKIGMAILTLDVASGFGVSLLIFFTSKLEGQAVFLLFIFSNLPSITWGIQILFLVLVSHTSLLFEDLNSQIVTILESSGPSGNIAKKLEMWRRKHVVVCELVDNINECFGIVLLISVGYYFVNFICGTYSLFDQLRRVFDAESHLFLGFITYLMSTLIRNMTHFILLVSMPYRMQRKAADIAESLRHCKCSHHRDPVLLYQVDNLLQEVHLHRPVLTAADFFPISPHLFPQLIGTTVSYINIVASFDN